MDEISYLSDMHCKMPGLARPMSHLAIVQKEKSDDNYKWIEGLRVWGREVKELYT